MNGQADRENPSGKAQGDTLTPSPIVEPAIEQAKISNQAETKSAGNENPTKELRRQFKLFEVLSLVFNGVLAFIGIWALVIYSGQLGVMRGTLAEMQRSGQDSTSQVWQAISNINWMARSMDQSGKDTVEQMKLQSKAMRRSADATVRAADAANATLKNTQTSFAQEQRAYVAVTAVMMTIPPTTTDKNGLHVCGDIHFSDSGRTPAMNIGIVRHATFGPEAKADVEAMAIADPAPITGDVLGIVNDKYGSACTSAVNDTVARNLTDSTETLYLYGIISYQDILEQPHEVGFCYQRVVNSAAFIGCVDDRGVPFGNWFERKNRAARKPKQH